MAGTDASTEEPIGRLLGALTCFRDLNGAVLLMKPTSAPAGDEKGWRLTGGLVGFGEPLTAAAVRAVKEVTGLTRELTQLLVIDRVSEGEDDTFDFVFDGGLLSPHDAEQVVLRSQAAGDQPALKWVPLGQVHEHSYSEHESLVRAAIRAVEAQQASEKKGKPVFVWCHTCHGTGFEPA
ncbi:NUDIX domain-containing protein [Streptomyces sp. NPDC004111]|uniref:NUDIX domain-containing protein n=1 Tax=Streptomyces sp. NPDC004111 TaxID=3364690 RepID=UPI0036C25977